MPLSDREQQILSEIEKGLLTEDPDGAVFEPSSGSSAKRRIKLGLLICLGGIGFLVAFFASGSPFLGLVAFGAMVGGIVLVAAGLRDLATEGFRDFEARRRFGEIVNGWEDKLRNRYRR